jgi:hypothetical protein
MLRDRENRDPFGRKPAISPGGGAERLTREAKTKMELPVSIVGSSVFNLRLARWRHAENLDREVMTRRSL